MPLARITRGVFVLVVALSSFALHGEPKRCPRLTNEGSVLLRFPATANTVVAQNLPSISEVDFGKGKFKLRCSGVGGRVDVYGEGSIRIGESEVIARKSRLYVGTWHGDEKLLRELKRGERFTLDNPMTGPMGPPAAPAKPKSSLGSFQRP
jgi:hypothetical protein